MMNANFAGLAFVYLYLIGFKQARPKIHIPHLRLEMVLYHFRLIIRHNYTFRQNNLEDEILKKNQSYQAMWMIFI